MRRILSVVLALLLVLGLVAPVSSAYAAGESEPGTSADWTPGDVSWTTESIPLPGGTPVLVIQKYDPWGYSDHLSKLASLGYAPTVADWAQIGVSVWLSDFRYIYVSSVQPDSFYSSYLAHKAELTSWVEAGGRLFFSVCTQGPVFELPGGAVHVRVLGPANYIADPAHPIVSGVLTDDVALRDVDLVGNSCSHNYFTVLPEQEHTILRDTDSHKPTLVEYNLGAGLVMGSGLTWEFYLANGSLDGNGAFALRAFDDLMLYTFPRTSHIITASAGAGGSISPSGDVTVYEGSSRTFTITANAGSMISSIFVDGVAVPITSRSAMTYTFSSISADHTISASFIRPDLIAPVIELPDGVPQSAVGSPYDLHLMVTDDRSISSVGVYENGQVVGSSLTGGDIRIRLALPDGRHDLVIMALDAAGNRTERAITLVVDTMPPTIVLGPIPASVSSAVLTVQGTVRDAVSGLRSFTIGGETVIPFSDGSFTEKLVLKKGDNTIIVEAVDNAGHVTSQTFSVKYAVSSSSSPSSLYVVLTIGSADMEVNGMTRRMDAAPFIKDGRTLLPIRTLIEALGGSVQWNASTKTATVTLGSRIIALTIGSKTALVNGSPVTLDVAPMIVNGHTFLPLRAVAENMGLDLAWEPVSRTISLTYWP